MASSMTMLPGDIIHLNVGGTRFSTSRQTLTWVPDSFFTSMLSGRISTLRDETGAIFIDRDPKLFTIILSYLRSKQIDFKDVDVGTLRHEAEFYGISPLVKRLMLCEDLHHSACGDVLFHGYLPPPNIPMPETPAATQAGPAKNEAPVAAGPSSQTLSVMTPADLIGSNRIPSTVQSHHSSIGTTPLMYNVADGRMLEIARPGSIVRVGDAGQRIAHSRNPSVEFRPSHTRSSSDVHTLTARSCHSHPSALDGRHVRTSSADLNKLVRTDLGVLFTNQGTQWIDPLRVRIVKGHHNWLAVVYAHFVTCYRNKDSSGWQLIYTSPHIEQTIERVALNAKVVLPNQSAENSNKMLAISYGSNIRLWGITEDGIQTAIGVFNLHVSVDYLFFIGSQLVALSHTGKVGVWNSTQKHWQIQDVVPITSFDTAGSFLLLGCNNGSIYYIDMQKFPLRMKDNDLLITELYRDSSNDLITAISVYLTPKTSMCGNWIEIAYGTSSGAVRVIVQHPETVGHGPQLFQTFSVHRSPVTKVMLSEKYLVSVCSEYNHVRAWGVTRFRGMISTQPGSTPLSSFKIVSLEDVEPNISYAAGNDCGTMGPYGEQDDEQVFIQKVVPETDQLYVRLSSTGKRICIIKSVDASPISAFCVHEYDGSNRMGSRSRRYVFTGHTTGAVQIWDMTTALDLSNKGEQVSNAGGPTPNELFRQLDQCDLSGSRCSTPCISPCLSYATHAAAKLKAANMVFLSQSHNQEGSSGDYLDDFRITQC